MHQTKFYTDRSAVETDDRCGMRFWYNRKEGGRGIVPKNEPFALAIGRETHLDLKTVAEMGDLSPEAIQALIQPILDGLTEDDKRNQKRMEVLYRRLGWLAAFALYLEPRIREGYETISIEKEIKLDRSPLTVGVTPDRVLRNRRDHKLIVYREYKTTITASQKWGASWHYQIQLHLGIAAASEHLKERVTFAQIMGLMKGYDTGDRLSHPYVWGWFNPTSNQWSCSYEKSRGASWMPMPVWEYPGGIVEWVQFCGKETAQAQFPHSPPVFLNERMLNEWIERRLYRERTIRAVEHLCERDQHLRSIHFERRMGQCRPSFGDECPYLQACWNAEINKDPLLNGEYLVRTPHHPMEYMSALEDLGE